MGCLCCGEEPDVGTLCRSCARAIEPSDGLIPEHICSRVDSTDAEAWLVDGFGGAHAVAEVTRIGRNHDRELLVLASSVSREHAELRRIEGGWVLRDLGSRNGTFVDGVLIQAPVALPARARIKFGDVALWFLAEVVHEPTRRPTMSTGASKGGLTRCLLTRGGIELCALFSDDARCAGALLWRMVGADQWNERALAPLEFQLLRTLCLRARDEAASPSLIRGCVQSKQLVNELPFQSKYANQENVRQIVLRLRGALAELGAAGMLAVAPGRGYYLACTVTATSAAAEGEPPGGPGRQGPVATPSEPR
jgi:hypothetical protein